MRCLWLLSNYKSQVERRERLARKTENFIYYLDPFRRRWLTLATEMAFGKVEFMALYLIRVND